MSVAWYDIVSKGSWEARWFGVGRCGGW